MDHLSPAPPAGRRQPAPGRLSGRPAILTGGIGAVLVVALVLAGGWVAETVARADGLSGLDRPVLSAMMAARTPIANEWITVFTHLGSTVPMVCMGVVATAALQFAYRRWSVWPLMLIAAAGSVALTLIGKAVFGRSRPPLADAVPPYEQSFSFPSGHALNATVISGMLAYLVFWLARTAWARWTAVAGATIWSLAMGLSRVYLGHHWLTDVVFAWIVGLAWLTVVITVHRLWLRSLSRVGTAAAGRTSPRFPFVPPGR